MYRRASSSAEHPTFGTSSWSTDVGSWGYPNIEGCPKIEDTTGHVTTTAALTSIHCSNNATVAAVAGDLQAVDHFRRSLAMVIHCQNLHLKQHYLT